MKKRKLLALLAVMLLVIAVLAGTASAASGTGVKGDAYKVNAETFTVSSSVPTSTRYISLRNLYSQTAGDYYADVYTVGNTSYATVAFDGSATAQVTGIYVRNGDYVELSAALDNMVSINGGFVTVSAANSVIGYESADLTVTGGAAVSITNKFANVTGAVILNNDVSVAGSPLVTGNGHSLTVTGGTASLKGTFTNVTVNEGAKAVVGENTYITTNLVTNGTLTLSSDQILCVNGTSLKSGTPVDFNKFQTWGKLPAGAYESVTGTWELTGAVEIKSTNDASMAGHTPHTSATIANAHGYGLTVTGGAVNAGGAIGAVKVNGGALTLTADTTAASIAINGAAPATGVLNINAGVSVTDGARALDNPALATQVHLIEWGVVEAVNNPNFIDLDGSWTLPAGAVLSLNSGGSIVGEGGELTMAENCAADISGSFSAVTLAKGCTLNVTDDADIETALTINGTDAEPSTVSVAEGKLLCDAEKAIMSADGIATLTAWGDVPAGEYDVLSGSWIHSGAGAFTVNGTEAICADTAHTHAALTITQSAGSINISGGDVTISDGDATLGETIVTGSVYLTGGELATPDKVSGIIYVTGGTITDTGSNNVNREGEGGTIVGTATSAADGTKLHAGDNAKNIMGSFAELTGTNFTLAGDTTVYSTNNGTESAIIDGGGYALTVKAVTGSNKNVISIKGEFSSIITEGDLHVLLVGDASVDAGDFGVVCEGDPASALTLGGAAAGPVAHVEGQFRQLTVNNGTVTDCGAVMITNSSAGLIVNGGDVTLDDGGSISTVGTSSTSVEAVNVTGGTLTFGTGADRDLTNIYSITVINTDSPNNKGIKITGGEVYLLDGSIESSGTTNYGVYVMGAAAKFHMGAENNTDACDSFNNPSITTFDTGSIGVYATAGGEAWLHAGDIYSSDDASFGVYVAYGNSMSGICHVWANDQYGENDVDDDPLLYIHCGNGGAAAMYVASNAQFDIRGRGALLEEPSDYGPDQYALYIAATATGASRYPLSGGTFNGDVRYVGGDLSSLIAYNHYLRYDCEMQDYGASDGTRGVVPGILTENASLYGSATLMTSYDAKYSVNTFDGSYDEYFGHNGEYYSIVDAEWELRQKMTGTGSYQIPAGIVRGENSGTALDPVEVPDVITLDINVFPESEFEYTPYWGVEKKLGDVDVTGTGHTLFLAGRTLRYNGFNFDLQKLTGITTAYVAYQDGNADENTVDSRQTLDVNPWASLAVRDSVKGAEAGAAHAEDMTPAGIGTAYIGTGTISYEYVVEDQTEETAINEFLCSNAYTYDLCSAAIHAAGALDIWSGAIRATESENSDGIFVNNPAAVVNIGMTDEDNDNTLIRILGGLDTEQNSCGIYMFAGTVNVNGGCIGDLKTSSAGGYYGIFNASMVGNLLAVKGGIIAGNDCGICISGSRAVAQITGGCIYGNYADDADNGGMAVGDSIWVDGGECFVKIDQAHKAYTEERIPTEGEGALVTSDKHHICNMYTSNGKLYVGALEKFDEQAGHVTSGTEVTNFTRNNGALYCHGGKTVFYDGVVIGDTTVIAASATKASSEFKTQFYVNSGDFGNLYIENAGDFAAATNRYYGIHGDALLTGCVQLHGGRFALIDVTGLTTGYTTTAISGATVSDIIGFWSDAYDMDDDPLTDNWVRYNHYAALDGAARSEAGYWENMVHDFSSADTFVSDAARTASAAGKAVVIHNGEKEITTWLESSAGDYDGVHGSSNILRCNIWLSCAHNNAQMCNSHFNCAISADEIMPLCVVGGGKHTLDTNGFGIFGDHDGTLLAIGSIDMAFVNSNADADEGYSNLLRNFSDKHNGYEESIALLAFGSTGQLNIQGLASRPVRVQAGGRAISSHGGVLKMENADILSTGVYGVYYAGDGTLTIKNSKVTDRYAEAQGTGVFAEFDDMGSGVIENSFIAGTENRSEGLTALDPAKLSITSSIIEGKSSGMTIVGRNEANWVQTEPFTLSKVELTGTLASPTVIRAAGGYTRDVNIATAASFIACDVDASGFSSFEAIAAPASFDSSAVQFLDCGSVTLRDSARVAAIGSGVLFVGSDAKAELTLKDSASIAAQINAIESYAAGTVRISGSALVQSQGTDGTGILQTSGQMFLSGNAKAEASGANGVGILNASAGVLNIGENAAVTGAAVGVRQVGGEVYITSGTITGTADTGCQFVGGTLRISGGTFNGALAGLDTGDSDTGESVLLSGGTYTSVYTKGALKAILAANNNYYDANNIIVNYADTLDGSELKDDGTTVIGKDKDDNIIYGQSSFYVRDYGPVVGPIGGGSMTATTYTVTFASNGGSDVEKQSVATGGVAKEPAAPTREGYAFDGWYKEKTLEQKFDFKTTITADITLYAAWNKIPSVADPAVTKVSDLLETNAHIAFIKGDGGLFQPSDNMTRAQAAQMLYNLLKNKDVAVTVGFDDVDAKEWYATAVNTLATLKIIDGYEDGTFGPGDLITREQFTAMAVRFAVQTEGVETFSDVDESNWSYSYIVTATAYGWISGYEDGTFGPAKNITRSEAVAFINRMLYREADESFLAAHAEELTVFSDVNAGDWFYSGVMEGANGHDYTRTRGVEIWTAVK